MVRLRWIKLEMRIRHLVGITLIEDMMRSRDALIRRVEKINIAQGKQLKGKAKITWTEVVKNDMKLLELEERMVADRNDWRRKIHVLDRV